MSANQNFVTAMESKFVLGMVGINSNKIHNSLTLKGQTISSTPISKTRIKCRLKHIYSSHKGKVKYNITPIDPLLLTMLLTFYEQSVRLTITLLTANISSEISILIRSIRSFHLFHFDFPK